MVDFSYTGRAGTKSQIDNRKQCCRDRDWRKEFNKGCSGMAHRATNSGLSTKHRGTGLFAAYHCRASLPRAHLNDDYRNYPTIESHPGLAVNASYPIFFCAESASSDRMSLRQATLAMVISVSSTP